MRANSRLTTPGEVIRFALRFFGWMLGFMGGFCVIINLYSFGTGGDISIAGLIVGAGMLAAGVAILRISRRFCALLEEFIPGVRLNCESVQSQTVDGNRPPDAGPSVRTGSGAGYRIDDRNRFIVSRKRSMMKAYYAAGVVFLVIAFFYGNGHNAARGDGSWEIDFISLILVLLGLTYLIVGGLNRYVGIDRAEDRVEHGWKWLCFPFVRRFPLHRFDHVQVKRLAHYESEGVSIWQPVDARWEVLLRGAESLRLIYVDQIFDARELAEKVADYTGFAVKEET